MFPQSLPGEAQIISMSITSLLLVQKATVREENEFADII